MMWPTSRRKTDVCTDDPKSPLNDPFTSNTAASWAKPGSGDAFNVNSSKLGRTNGDGASP
jgi:hypothetical protein